MKSKINPKRHRRYAIAGDGLGLFYLLLLGGCTSFGNVMTGSSQSQGSLMDDDLSADASKSINGRVINGYLANALVFQDVNNDGLLSKGESLTVTGIDGIYSLAEKTGNIIVKPINRLSDDEKISAAPTLNSLGLYNPDLATTYYVDDSGGIVNFTGRMQLINSNVSSNYNVTPLTTLVAGLVGSGKYNLQAAEQKVAYIFGVDSHADYIALSRSVSSSESSVGIVAKNRAVGFSNFISTALDFYSDTVSDVDVLKTLSVFTTENFDEASQNGILAPDWSKMLASASDIKAILSKIALENQLQIDLEKFDAAVGRLVLQNKNFVIAAPISLAEDTGLSGVDGITSNSKLLLDSEIANLTGGAIFSMKPGLVNYQDVSTSLQWTSSISAIAFSEGLNTLFVRPSVALDQKLYQFSFLLDTMAPNVLVSSDLSLFQYYESAYFLSDGNNYSNSLLLNSEYLDSYLNSGERVYPEYQVVEVDEDGAYSQPTEDGWAPFLNLSSKQDYDGYNFRTYFRVTDLAGNQSSPEFFDVVLDNVAPLALSTGSVELENDSGIYSYDRYSNSIQLDPLTTLVANNYQDATTTTIQQWTVSGDMPDDDGFLLDAPVPYLDGEYTFWVKQVDRAGNESEVIAVSVVLDTEAPNLPDEITFDYSDWSRGLAVKGLDFSGSLLEWAQYKIVSKSPSLEGSPSWKNINLIEKTGEYDIYYRIIDRAGNVSPEKFLGTLSSDFTAPVIQPTSSLTFSSKTQLDEYFLTLSNQQLGLGNVVYRLDLSRDASGINLVHEWVASKDVSGNVSIPLEFSFVLDEQQRHLVDLETLSSPWIYGRDGFSNLFDLSRQMGESYNLIGAQASDRVNNLMPGDIFLGLEGIDYGVFDASQVLYGISFLTRSELDFIYGSAAIDPNVSPVYKIYSEDKSNPDEGGMSIVQADLLEYRDASGKAQLLLLEHFSNLETWVINLGEGDDQLYFGGEAIAVNGGSGADHLQGGTGQDFLISGSGSLDGIDLLQGYGGDDFLVGGDYLFLSDGHYRLEGGTGDDILVAGNGHGELIGADGRDFYWIAPIDGSIAPVALSIVNFNPNEDKICFLNWHLEDAYKGVFVDSVQGSVQIDLAEMIGAPYGSVLNITGVDTTNLLPELVVESWLNSYSTSDFAWADLSIESLII